MIRIHRPPARPRNPGHTTLLRAPRGLRTVTPAPATVTFAGHALTAFMLPAGHDPRIIAHVHSSDYQTWHGALLGSWGKSWNDLLNDGGAGAVNLALTDPDIAHIVEGRLIRFDLDNVARFTAVIERIHRQAVAQGEEHDQVVNAGGRGHIALLEDAVVYPELGAGWEPSSELRYFNYASKYIDVSAWATPVDTPLSLDPVWDPEGFPDPGAGHIWDRLTNNVGVPAGDCYFHSTFVSGDQIVSVHAHADDLAELWIDGVFVGAVTNVGASAPVMMSVPVRVSAGTHTIRVKATNLNDLKATFRMTVMNEDHTTVLRHTDATNWKVLAYPAAEPGFTVGKMVRHLLAEAQVRGALAGWGRSFTDTRDADGVAWPTNQAFFFRTGLDYLSMLRELSEKHDVDFAARPNGLALRLWHNAGRGAPTAVAFTPGVNITDLAHEEVS